MTRGASPCPPLAKAGVSPPATDNKPPVPAGPVAVVRPPLRRHPTPAGELRAPHSSTHRKDAPLRDQRRSRWPALRPPPAAGAAGPLPAHVVLPPREPPRPPRVTARPAALRRPLPAGGCRHGKAARARLRRFPGPGKRPRRQRHRPRPRWQRVPLRPAAPPSWRLCSQRGHCRARHVTAARSALQLPATPPRRPAPRGTPGTHPFAAGRAPRYRHQPEGAPGLRSAGGHLEGGQTLGLRRHRCDGRGRGGLAQPRGARWEGRRGRDWREAPPGGGAGAHFPAAPRARPAGSGAHVGAAGPRVSALPGKQGQSCCGCSGSPSLGCGFPCA